MCTSNTIKIQIKDEIFWPDYISYQYKIKIDSRKGQTNLISHIKKKDASCRILLFYFTGMNCIL